LGWEFFTAKRILFRKVHETRISRPIVNIAVISIALSISVIIVSVSIALGFKKTIRNKVIGFTSNIEITHFDSNNSFESSPIDKRQPFYPGIESLSEIKHIQVYATKAGIIKTKSDFQGIVLKGVDNRYDWKFIQSYLVEGKVLSLNDTVKSKNVLISEYIAKLLKLKLGDPLIVYFVQDPPRIRKFKIKGIYNTGFEDFDTMFAFVDIRQIQKLNDWDSNRIGGFEVEVNDLEKLETAYKQVFLMAGNSFQEDGSRLRVQTVYDKYPFIFDWLSLFDTNVYVIIILLLIVAAINMSSGLLILILEKTPMIGILKTLGATNKSVQSIFLNVGSILVGKGLIYGDILGVGLVFLQNYTHWVKLDPSSYYVSFVPVEINGWYFLLLNIGALTAMLLILILPSFLVAKIHPSKTIRFN